MAHIKLTEDVPGIRGPMLFSPETTKPMREFVEVPHDAGMYRQMGKRLATTGYLMPGWERPVAKPEAKQTTA